jgi:hypothetical protein
VGIWHKCAVAVIYTPVFHAIRCQRALTGRKLLTLCEILPLFTRVSVITFLFAETRIFQKSYVSITDLNGTFFSRMLELKQEENDAPFQDLVALPQSGTFSKAHLLPRNSPKIKGKNTIFF